MLDLSDKLTYERNFKEIAVAARFDAQYFQPKYEALVQRLKDIGPVETIGEWGKVLKGRSVGEYIDAGVPVIRSGDLVDLDSLNDVKYADSSEDLFYLQSGDVLISSIGLGSIGKVQVFDKPTPHVTVSEVTVIRQTRVDPYYLQTFLRSSAGQLQIEQRITGATGQLHLYARDVATITVPILAPEKQHEVRVTLDEALEKKRASQKLYAEAEALLLEALDLDQHMSIEAVRDTSPILDGAGISDILTYEGTFKGVVAARRFDAQYFHPEKVNILAQLEAMPGEPVGSYFESIFDLIDPLKQSGDETVYNYDLTDALRYFLTDDTEAVGFDQIGSAKKQFQRGDVVVSRLRSYLKEIALIETPPGVRCVGSSEFYVLRPRSKKVSAELLLVYLRAEPVQRILKWCQDGSQHPRFKEGEILTLNLPNRLLDVQEEVTRLVRQGIEAYQQSNWLLEEAKERVESLILGAA